MKSLRKLLSIMLVASMLLSTNATTIFAEGINKNNEEQLNDETFESSEEESIETNAESDVESDAKENDDFHNDEELSESAVDGEEESLDVNDGKELEEEEEETTVNTNEEEKSSEESLLEPTADGEESTETNANEELEKETTDNEAVIDDVATISEAEEVIDDNIATASEIEEEIAVVASRSNAKKDNALYGSVPGDYWGNHNWETHSGTAANVAHANNQDQMSPNDDNLLILWTFNASGYSTEWTWDAQDLIEEVAPMGKKFFGFYEIGGGPYATAQDFYDAYDWTKDWTAVDTSLGGTIGSLSYANAPRYYGVVYDDALTIKYMHNFPSHDYFLEDDSKWQSKLQREDLYVFEGSLDAEHRKYAFRGTRLFSGNGEDVTAKNYEGTSKLTLVGWNTKADGTGTFYNLGDLISDETPFTDNHLTLYGVWQNSDLVKRVKYDSNVDMATGYQEYIWMDQVTGDTINKPIVLIGENVINANWADLKQKTLIKWNTAADGTGIDYEIGATISDYSTSAGFDDNGVLKLYAVWGEPTDLTFNINYQQNVPAGWTLQGTWNMTNVVNSQLPITLASGNGIKIKNNTTGEIRHLVAWSNGNREFILGQEIKKEDYTAADLFDYGRQTTVTLMAVYRELYSVVYDQNLGDFTLDGDWFADGTSVNPEWVPITVLGSSQYDQLKIGRKNNDLKYLVKWNTAADGTGTDYSFGTTINNPSLFDSTKTLTLYAQWVLVEEALYSSEPTLYIAYLDKDSTTSTKEAVLACDPTTMTEQDITDFIVAQKPTWAQIGTSYFDIPLYLQEQVIIGKKDIYKKYLPGQVSADDELSSSYNSVKNYGITKYIGVAYTVPIFMTLGIGTGGTGEIVAPINYGEADVLSDYLDGKSFRDETQNPILDTDYTGIWSLTEEQFNGYNDNISSYSGETGASHTTVPTIVGKSAILDTYNTWMNSFSSSPETVYYAFSYAELPFMYWTYSYSNGKGTLSFYKDPGTNRYPLVFELDGNAEYRIDDTTTQGRNVIDIIEFVDNIEAKKVKGLFKDFRNVTSFKGLDKLDLSNVTSFESMFENCKNALTTLDLRNISTTKVTNMDKMFYDCEKLTTIYVNDSFDVSNVTSSTNMFGNCEALEGAEGTKYDSSHIDKTYARIDESTTKPGYFSPAPAERSTLDGDGAPKFYIVAFDGTTKTKKIHSITKTANETTFDSELTKARAELPDPTCSILGYNEILSKNKDVNGHRVFLSLDDLQAAYDETSDATTYTSDDELKAAFNNYKAASGDYDLYFGLAYSPFISEITGIEVDYELPKVEGLAYIPIGESFDTTGLKITVKYTDGSTQTLQGDDIDLNDVKLTPAVFSKGDTQLVITYKGIDFVMYDNIYAYQDEDAYDITGIATNPIKTVYVEGEKFDPTGMVINAHDFNDPTGDTISISYDDNKSKFTIPTTPIAAGDTTVTIKYGGYDGCTYDVPITVLKKGQSGEIKTNPTQTYYDDGDILDSSNLSGLEVTIHYPEGSDPAEATYKYADNPEYFEITPQVNSVLTPNTDKLIIKISGTVIEYPIVVLPSGDPTSSSKGQDPDKTQYEVGDNFDPTGLKIKVTYPGNIIKTIEYNDETKNDFTFVPELTTELTSSDTEVKVSFRGSPASSFPITVRKKPVGIEVITSPTTTTYSKGDKFDPTGLVIRVEYDGGETEDIPYNSSTASGFTFEPALDQAFTDGDVDEVVKVTFGSYTPAIEIDGVEPILPESFSYVKYDSKTGSVVLVPNDNLDPNNPSSVESIRVEFEQMLDEALANGATGFHEYSANGLNDAKKKYDKYTPATMTKEEALARFDDYVNAGGTGNLFIGPSFKKPNSNQTPTPKPNSSSSSSSSDSSGSSSTNGPMGVINTNTNTNITINTFNSIPQSNLFYDTNLSNALNVYPENLLMPKTNVEDIDGNKGFGQWQRVPGTVDWYFLSGDLNANGTKGNAGFLQNGWFKLDWDGQTNWFHFGANGKMTLGWYQEGKKIYFLQNNFNDKQYGKAVTGTQIIDGKEYNFDKNGVFIADIKPGYRF